MGCFIFDSLLLSTLECYYLDSCLIMYYSYINYSFRMFTADPPLFRPRPLTYDLARSRFPPNTSLSVIVKELMVEEWNLFFSFERYYEACAPVKCIYPHITPTNSFINIVITLISTVSGLAALLRMVTPILVTSAFSLFKSKNKPQKNQRSGNFFISKVLYSSRVIHCKMTPHSYQEFIVLILRISWCEW